MSAVKITEGIYSVGIQNPNMRVFDIVMKTDSGTTYNSYVVKGSEKTALIETCHEGFFHQYLPEASWNRSLFFHASLFEDSPRFRQCHGLEMSPLLRELLFAVDDLKPDFTTEEGKRFALVLMDRLKASKEVGGPLLMPSEHRLVELCAAALAAPDAPICMADWSRHLGMSEKTLARLFIRQTGQTFGRWLQIMRLQHAMTEIEQGQSVTAVALDCGYNSVSAFISAFKKHFGTFSRQAN